MKKLFVGSAAVAAALFMVPVAGAQTVVRIGPMAGLNLSTLKIADPGEVPDVDSRVGPLFGGFLSVDVSRSFSIQPELLYTQFGAKFPIEDADAAFKLGYVQVPVLARIRFPGANVTPFLQAGPALAFKTSCKVKASEGGVSVQFDCDDPDADFASVKSTSFSGIVGAGLEIGNVLLALRYDHGFTNLINDAGPGESARNRVLSLTVGYGFRLGAR